MESVSLAEVTNADATTHEHGIHSHGNCHVPMTQPAVLEWQGIAAVNETFRAPGDENILAGLAFLPDRPPRA